jgi:UDP-N-acetylmuramate dehydrogenase
LNLRENIPLAPYTTIGLGGPARYLAECATVEDVREALAFAREHSLLVQVMGRGSNLIFSDAGFGGLVLRVTSQGYAFRSEPGATTVTAAAGAAWDDLVQESVRRRLAGIECLSGIPGSVGGTPIQNVGAYGQEIAETLVSVTCIARDTLEPVVFAKRDCGFGYRSSRFKRDDRDAYVVTEVAFRLYRDRGPELRYPELVTAVSARRDPLTVRLVRETVLALRRGKSMVLAPDDPNTRSVGSFFLNPVLSAGAFAELDRRWRTSGGSGPIPSFPAPNGVKVPAAWLVEHAGYRKGQKRGGVGISSHHALALVSHGGTTAELLALASEIEHAVDAKFGVRLEKEPVIVGADERDGERR